ncbi:MAG: anthranilate synthase component I family protein [Candidatus Omnitrophica bacterium]|nr:anthranilate synthase component I family protein [Candidatus Omnitrophota bacterium]
MAVELFEQIRDGAYPFLLESARQHPITGRWSFLGCDPSQVVRVTGTRDSPLPAGQAGARGLSLVPLQALRTFLAQPPMVTVEGLPPFVGGAVGVFGYDFGRCFERWPHRAVDDLRLPDLCVGLYETVVAVDHLTETVWGITRMTPDGDPERAYGAAVARLETLERRLAKAQPSSATRGQSFVARSPEIVAEMGRPAFERMVREAKRWIADGEIYQANLSQRLSAPLADSPWALYRRLCAVNPSPFAAYFDAGDVQLVGASPERLVRLQDGVVETRPIAGTRPRTGDPAEDRRLLDELLAHPKERAEHLMLVDLERNDLGRVCTYGSVAVSDLMTLEQYSHVSHIVSNIRGRLAPGRDWLDVLAAVFPGGTITGCPKVRAIECIDALEPVRRQWYTGSIGYVSFTGAMDLNIIIRSAIVTGGRVYAQVGAGIVADSDPAREYEETLHKARALLVALKGSDPTGIDPVGSDPIEVSHAVAV